MGYVATRFGHLYYIPLLPMGSFFVIEDAGDDWQGAPIALSGKSVLLAWFRAALIAAVVVAGLFFAVGLCDPIINTESVTISGLACFGSLGLFIATKTMKFFTQASYHRAKQIAQEVGFSQEGNILVDMVYGEITEREAERKFDAIQEDGLNAFEGHEGFSTHRYS